MQHHPQTTDSLDLREKGAPKNGEPQFSDRRLFVQFQAFGNCSDTAPLVESIQNSGLRAALYTDTNNPYGIGIAIPSESPDTFVNEARDLFCSPPFSNLEHRPHFTMLGRSYATGYEPDLDEALIHRPQRNILNPEWPWAIWYPLRRKGDFAQLDHKEQREILMEHASIGRTYGRENYAHDIRLACHGLDKNDNDFIIGLVGADLYPLSRVVQDMRRTRQTARFIESLGPFFVGKAIWQSPT
ncbi:MAG: chlorite dismutase family protein [bacterium]|nr:chlorite dismutase family protein [bacterium]